MMQNWISVFSQEAYFLIILLKIQSEFTQKSVTQGTAVENSSSPPITNVTKFLPHSLSN